MLKWGISDGDFYAYFDYMNIVFTSIAALRALCKKFVSESGRFAFQTFFVVFKAVLGSCLCSSALCPRNAESKSRQTFPRLPVLRRRSLISRNRKFCMQYQWLSMPPAPLYLKRHLPEMMMQRPTYVNRANPAPRAGNVSSISV